MPALTSRLRWLVGGGAVVLAGVLVVGAIAVLGARPVPPAMTYVPRDSVVVVELRSDFPGDQLSKIGNLLAHFPGYKDQSILGQKLDETLAKITRSVTSGGVDYASQVKPWLAGPLYAGGSAGASSGASNAGYVVVFTTDGTVTCAPFTGSSPTTETYRGLTLDEAGAGPAGACAIDGRQAVVGSVGWVKAALDAHATNQGIDGLADYRTARDRLGGDRLATLYVARGALTAQLGGGLGRAMPSLDPAIEQAVAGLPAWVIAGIRAEDNALVVDVVSAPFKPTGGLPGMSVAPGSSLLSAPPAHASQVAGLLPADTAVLYEVHGLGAGLQNLLTEVRALPDVGSQLGQLDAVLGTLGGVPSLLDWIGDAGVVVMPDGASATGGLVVLAPDDATASAKAAQLVALLRLAGLSGGATTNVSETTIDGTTVTLADFGDLSSLVSSAGATALGGLSIPPGTHLVVSIAAHGSAVLIGSGEAFVRRILETDKGSTLADQASYRNAVALASAQNDGQLYVAVAPVLALVETNLPAADRTRYQSDYQPYLAPLDAILETTTSDASGLRVRLVLTVK